MLPPPAAPSPAPVPPGRAAGHPRLYEIDLLRFLAALSVVLFHYSFRGGARDGFTSLQYPALWPAAQYGYLGVNLFFIISGFVVLMSAMGSTPKRFAISRLVRLYPAFWFCCLLTFAVSVLSADPRFVCTWRRLLPNLTMMHEFLGIGHIDGVYWSLTVELRFYFLIMLLLLLGRMGWLGRCLALWLVASVVLGPMGLARGPLRYASRMLFPDYAAYFVAGAGFYLAYREGWSVRKAGLILASLALAIHSALRQADQQSAYYGVHFNRVVVVAFIVMFFALFALIASKRLTDLASPRFVILGALTYPLYLIHQHIGYILFNALRPRVDLHLLFWGVVALMILAAWAINRGVERPLAKPFKAWLERVLPEWPWAPHP